MKKKSSFSFSAVPKIYVNRSRFNMSFSHKTTINQGEITPVLLQEIYPGDSFKCKSTYVMRTTSNILRPIMDNLFVDMYYFFCPSRLLYDKWSQIFGENDLGPWAESHYAQAPMNLESDDTDMSDVIGGVADHLGLPVQMWSKGVAENTFNILPFRAFAKIYDDWFRDENIISPMNIQTGESNREYINGNEWSINNYFGKLPKVAKLHDYFTSALPSPQKGNPVTFNIVSGYAPVVPTNNNYTSLINQLGHFPIRTISSADGDDYSQQNYPFSLGGNGDGKLRGNPSSSANGENVAFGNLGAYLNNLEAISVNDMRFAFQLQKMLERDARGGTRYTEYIQSHYGVLNPDSRLQRSEYLGGSRNPLSISQVIQTTGSNAVAEQNSLGDVGAFSLSGGNSGFKKSFTEHGFVLGFAVVRQIHNYQQGLAKMWTRYKRTDYYDPVFANIGEQPIYSKELYASAENIKNDNIFGYNEAWADLRYNNNVITGQMRSGVKDSFDIWHLADYYSSSPVYSKEFIEENEGLKQVMAVLDAPTFICDFYHKVDAIRPLPLYSVPGLIDHH